MPTHADEDGFEGEREHHEPGTVPATDSASDTSLVPVSSTETSKEVGELVTRLMDDDTDEPSRTRLMRTLAAALTRSARAAGAKGMASGRWLTDLFVDDIAPRIPVRDRETLLRHYGGGEASRSDEEIADTLVRNATRATTTVGAAGGALAAVQFAAPPLLLTAPAQVVAETVVVAAIEVKLIAELHELYGTRPDGGSLQRTSTYLFSWAKKRGIDPLQATESVTVALGAAAKTALRTRLMRLLGRHLSTLGPYLSGAIAGGTLNRAATRALAKAVRADLRPMVPPERRHLGPALDRAARHELPPG
ncbi:hypothetical protein [Salinactinospora qingdaonensis]|uniref:EcsC protein family protein n=1 Tax=Salinactinospora qingdaonensis TaxID=702744 RepID=A0ABP7F440_9ACTN